MSRFGLPEAGLAMASVLLALGAAEFVVRQIPAEPSANEHMDAGLIRYDHRLGWALNPGWQGRHRHDEFAVSYRVDATGGRFSPSASAGERWRERTLWLGDSMTFGLGVDDADTFVERLNGMDARGRHFNHAVPGYSTDQQILAFEALSRRYRFDRAIMVTYLANDLVDNALPYPMNALHRKPRFRFSKGVLSGPEPMPTQRRPKPQDAPLNLGQVFLTPGERFAMAGYGAELLARGRRLAAWYPVGADDLESRAERFVALFAALRDRWFTSCERGGVKCQVLLLPGRSFVERPEGLSAQIQQALLDGLSDAKLRHGDQQLIAVPSGQKAYFPRDGHLTPGGHALVAELLVAVLDIDS